jgi:hypothetical protein
LEALQDWLLDHICGMLEERNQRVVALEEHGHLFHRHHETLGIERGVFFHVAGPFRICVGAIRLQRLDCLPVFGWDMLFAVCRAVGADMSWAWYLWRFSVDITFMFADESL